jgi:hypothetical protein
VPADPRLALRDVALRLRAYQQFKKTNSGGKRELLDLLKSGQIQAAFDYPSTLGPKIAIPAKFWLGIPTGRFQKKLTWKSQSSDREGGGHYLVEPAQFVNEYVTWLKSHVALNSGAGLTDDVAVEIASALASKLKQSEVYVPETEWDRFVRNPKLDITRVDEVPGKSTRGRDALRSWDVVLVEVAAELLARQLRGEHLDEHSTIASIALERAKKTLASNNPAPKVDTVAKKVSEILERINALAPDNAS